MYKLTVVAGPNRGTSYAIQDGETSIGRQTGNVIVLPSAKVSKKHCTLVVNNGEIQVTDQGSSNGTFVNGVMTKAKKIKAGDRISVGEYVLEIVKPQVKVSRPAPAAGIGNVVQFPARGSTGAPVVGGMPGMPNVPGGSGTGVFPGAIGGVGGGTNAMMTAQVPTDLKGKALYYFDKSIMPFFYGLNFKHEWRIIGVGLLAAFVLGNLVVSVYPLMESGRATVIKETGRRAKFMARQIAERNSGFLAARMESKAEIGTIDREPGVRVAVLTDLEGRIIAPGTMVNQYLTGGSEATLAIKARDLFRGGRETGLIQEVDDSTIVAIEPVKVLNAQMGQNVVAAMAVVSLDTSISTPSFGDMSVVYSETLILTAILGGLLLMVLYRLTLKPFQVLNDDIDKVLKGDMGQVTHEFKVEELNQLWDVINSALQRVPKGGSPGDAFGGGGGGVTIDDFSGPLRMLGDISKYGMAICDGDKRIVYLNPMFEEISGIRSDNSAGQEITAVARDQAFGMFCKDAFERAPVGGAPIVEDFDFSGIMYKMHISALGSAGGTAKGFVMAAQKAD